MASLQSIAAVILVSAASLSLASPAIQRRASSAVTAIPGSQCYSPSCTLFLEPTQITFTPSALTLSRQDDTTPVTITFSPYTISSSSGTGSIVLPNTDTAKTLTFGQTTASDLRATAVQSYQGGAVTVIAQIVAVAQLQLDSSTDNPEVPFSPSLSSRNELSKRSIQITDCTPEHAQRIQKFISDAIDVLRVVLDPQSGLQSNDLA